MNNTKGNILPMVVAIMLLLMIIIPTIVEWSRQQTKTSIKIQGRTIATNLAEAGIERAVWKISTSTGTWDEILKGNPIPGYNFDVLYDDIEGGVYRIKFSSGPDYKNVTIISEGKDTKTGDVRAIKAVYKNQVIPGAIISKGQVHLGNHFYVHWGPVMGHGDIILEDGENSKCFFPRKFSRNVVWSKSNSYPRDTNGLNPPNQGEDWWSDYPVPDLPILDFATLRSSASANCVTYLEYDRTVTQGGKQYKVYLWKKVYTPPYTPPSDWISSTTINTLNVYGCSKLTTYKGPKWWEETWVRTSDDSRTTQALSSCNLGANEDHTKHFQNPWRHPAKLARRVWYWDGDVTFTGSTAADGCGIWGTVIIRGNWTNYCGDNLKYTDIGEENCKVPSEAWREYEIIRKVGNTTYKDTSAKNEYPADDGLRKNRATFKFGAETWSEVGDLNPPSAANTDVGIVGFVYVGGDCDIEGPMDFYGALWIVGNVSRAAGVAEMSTIFFDENLELPSLNVVLVRKMWQFIKPSDNPW